MSNVEWTIRKIINAIDGQFDPAIGQQIVVEGNYLFRVKTNSGKPWEKDDEVKVPSNTHNIAFLYDEAVVEALSKEGYSGKYGARHLDRVIEKLIEIPLAQMLVNQPRSSMKTIRCLVETGVISLRYE